MARPTKQSRAVDVAALGCTTYALVIGYDPQAIPGVDGEALRESLDKELARFGEHGIDAAMALVVFDKSGEPALVATLAERPWDVVVAEAGSARRSSCSRYSNGS